MPLPLCRHVRELWRDGSFVSFVRFSLSAIEDKPPEVDTKSGKKWPFADIGPAQRVTSYGPGKLKSKGGGADCETEKQPEMQLTAAAPRRRPFDGFAGGAD